MGSAIISFFIWSVPMFLTFFCPFVLTSDNETADSLDSLLRSFAFEAVVQHRPHTSVLYKADLPSNLSGIQVSVVRLRSRNFWLRGANFSAFRIPPSTLPVPYVRRIAIVYVDLGNWSSHQYNVRGYRLTTPVVGFMVYNASNSSSTSFPKLDLDSTRRPISVHFPNSTLNSTGMKCAAFYANGTTHLSDMSLHNVCFTEEQGHFSIVVPVERKRVERSLREIEFLIGFSVLFVLVSIVGMVILKQVKAQG
ncbi:uncharacterized protein LOC131158438 [Malania oleifera]|uniref:uncharacterized protein LOC131158438 n=1 Tax=Malania oleifera TaxID=397392 RepID=UPI0025ADF3FA|nr:uncharacterized protein LOC131158438 [Malania oleifera]